MLQRLLKRMEHARQRQFAQAHHYRQSSAKPMVMGSPTQQPNERKNMNAQDNRSGYMLLFVGMDWHRGLSPEQTQKVSEDWMTWFKALMEEGKAVAGHPLGLEGKSVSGRNRAVTDGPFAEAKEAIGGYFLLNVVTLDEAVAIARQCPGLPFGAKVEVRPVLSNCPLAPVNKIEEALAGAK
jgi:hypothetical protein